MPNNRLHIVCFTIPFPVNYGGVFDLFYKLEALKDIGLDIHLHCIQYGNNKPQQELEKYCEKVAYYKRKKIFPIRLFGMPYIVKSRVIAELVKNLNEDDAPILIEGIHGSGIIPLLDKNRKIRIRLHNVEYVYYHNLAKTSNNLFKKAYYKIESNRLKNWEKYLVENGLNFDAVSLLDKKIYETKLSCKNVSYVPLFLRNWKKKDLDGLGDFCLYQGNLDIEENQVAIQWLMDEVFDNIDYPLYIVGKSNGSFVQRMRAKNPTIHWIENPSDEEMQNYIEKAQIHLLPSFNSTGIKLKLLHALYKGRFCLVNTPMVMDSGLETLCIIADSATGFKEKIKTYFTQTFSNEEQEARYDFLSAIYDNKKNAILLKQKLFEE